jgi:hypothetical protein
MTNTLWEASGGVWAGRQVRSVTIIPVIGNVMVAIITLGSYSVGARALTHCSDVIVLNEDCPLKEQSSFSEYY